MLKVVREKQTKSAPPWCVISYAGADGGKEEANKQCTTEGGCETRTHRLSVQRGCLMALISSCTRQAGFWHTCAAYAATAIRQVAPVLHVHCDWKPFSSQPAYPFCQL